MKTIGLNDLVTRLLLCRGRVVISLAAWEFHVSWESEIFKKISEFMISDFPFKEDGAPDGVERLGYFSVPEDVCNEVVERVARHPSVRLFLCSPRDDFLSNIPSIINNAICYRNELSDEEIDVAGSISGFDWFALRDGDEGDAFYYLFESQKI